MLPILLSPHRHDKQASMRQLETLLDFMVVFSAHLEGARSSQRHRSNDGIFPEQGFIIRMPSDFVLPIPVQVRQNRIESYACFRLHARTQGFQNWR